MAIGMTQMDDRNRHWSVFVDMTDGYGKPFRATAVTGNSSAADVVDPPLVNKRRLPHGPMEKPTRVWSGEGTL